MDHFMTVMLVFISTINHLYKLFTFHVYRERIRKVLEVVDGPLFAALTKQGEKELNTYTGIIGQLMKAVHISVCMCLVFWFIAPFANRYKYGQAVIPAYFPFSTETIEGFVIAVLYKNIVILWIGLGHVTLDCIIAAFYGQTKVQLSILRNNLEILTDIDQRNYSESNIGFKDSNNAYKTEVENRLIYCIRKYQMIYWYTKEVESIFNKVQIFQLAMSIVSLCVVMYKFIEMSSLSFDTFFLGLYYFSFLMQLFPFCYCGTLIEYESNTINTAIFYTDWISLSPRFRKLMLFAMMRWTRPINISIANIVPMSLSTFINVLKLSYSLYTLLKETSH